MDNKEKKKCIISFLADTLDGLIKIFALYLKHCLGTSDSQGRFVQSYSWSQMSIAPKAGALNSGGPPNLCTSSIWGSATLSRINGRKFPFRTSLNPTIFQYCSVFILYYYLFYIQIVRPSRGVGKNLSGITWRSWDKGT